MNLITALPLLVSVAFTHPCVKVRGSVVTAANLAAALPELGDLPPDQVLFHAPAIGLVRHITPGDLRRAVGRSVTVGNSTCIERESMRLGHDQVWPALLQALPSAPSVLEIVEMSRYPVPPGRIEFLLSGLMQPPAARAADVLHWNGRVVPESGSTVRIWARVRVAIEADVLRAKTGLPRRHVLTAAEIEVRREAGRIKEVAEALTADRLIGCIVVRQLGAGDLLTRSHFRCLPKPAIVEQAEARLQVGNVLLKVRGSVTGLSREATAFRFQGQGMKKAVPARRSKEGTVEVSVQ